MYVCEACGSESDQPGTCTGPEDGYAHEPTERVTKAPPGPPTPFPHTAAPTTTDSTTTVEGVETVDPANGTEEVPQ